MSIAAHDTHTLPVTQWRDVINMEPGVQLAAAGWIPEHPKAIALISHGHVEHLGRYGHVVNALVGDGFAVYGQDHRGHGRSSGPRALITDFDRTADDLHILAVRARHRQPGIPMVLIGHSMGGLIALRYALKYQDELTGVVTSGPAVIIDEGVPEAVSTIGKVFGKVAPTAPTHRPQHNAAVDEDTGLSEASFVAEQFEIDHRNWHGDTMLGTASAMLESAENTRERFGELRLPLLAMHGSDDTITSPRGTELLYAGASSGDKTIIVWKGCEHEIFSAPGRDTVIETMRLWLTERVQTSDLS